MTGTEKQRRMLDVKAAEQNFRDCIARSVPRGPSRTKAIDKARLARSIACNAIWKSVQP